MLYVDTSVFVAALTREVETYRMQTWLGERQAGELFISGWVIAEFSSALSIKLRTGQIDLRQRDIALSAFQSVAAASLHMLPINGSHFAMAARFADRHDSNLRAADALHLAVASDHNTTLCTLDKALAQAGTLLGMTTNYLAPLR